MSLLLAVQGGGAYSLTALAGSYSLTGGSATPKVGRKVTALAGSYALTGGSAVLTKAAAPTAYALTALAGSYSLTGGTASITWSGGTATDTHDGWWAKQWQKKKKKPEEVEQPIEVLVSELVEEVIQKAKQPRISIPVPLPSTALERTQLIERILLKLIEDEDEFEIEMLML